MSREVHVRFCESGGVQFPSATHLANIIGRAMRELAKRRAAKLTPERRKAIASKAGHARWDNLSDEQRIQLIERMQKARKCKPIVN
jgi:hypothetical protein